MPAKPRWPNAVVSRLFIFLALLPLLIESFTGKIKAEEPDEFFERHVRPILVDRCYSCHADTKNGGGLSLESADGWRKGGDSGPAIVPGAPDDSLLIAAIRYESLEMPPADAGGQLSAEEIDALTQWVKQGAPDPRVPVVKLGGMSLEEAKKWWAFQPLPTANPISEHSSLPSRINQLSTQIDSLVDQRLSDAGLTPAQLADKRTLIRRATYDLTGLPPTTAEVDAFLADESPTAFAQVIDRLLESPQYGVHWGRHWLDVVRYADTAGENTDRPLPHAWRYRNWVMQSVQRDMPFDDFARWQISGDLITADASAQAHDEGIIATGYLAIARRFGHDIDKDVHLTYEDAIDNLGKNFLGITLGCARCHDHKYDPVTSSDYYALYGILASTKFSFPGCEPSGQPRDLIPLSGDEEYRRQQALYETALTAFEQHQSKRRSLTTALQVSAQGTSTPLATGIVSESSAVTINLPQTDQATLAVPQHGVLQWTIARNGNHGADSTSLDILITRLEDGATWSTAELVSQLSSSGPLLSQRDAYWCLLEKGDTTDFLPQKRNNIEGQSALHGWSRDDTPSIFVNQSDQPVSVWTTLPPRTFFVHPGPQSDVAVAWVCPQAGTYRVETTIADAHPAALDGIAYQIELITSSEHGQQLVALGENVTELTVPTPPEPLVAYAVTEAQPIDVKEHLRGDPEQLGEVISRRWLSLFGGQPVSSNESGRRELANWIVDQPLFARVLANRLWQWHFGNGIVTTPNDFGSRGQLPSHPELLETLAGHLRDFDYQLKPMHRAIMLSAAYQRSSLVSPETHTLDPANAQLSHFNRRRLTAEEIRDSLLAASGQLDLTLDEAHPFPPSSSWTYTQHTPFNAVYESNHRSAFLMVQRQRRHPYLALFDGADPNSSTPQRHATTVPTQALYFLNDPFFHEQAASIAALANNAIGVSATLQANVHWLLARTLQREPTPEELSLAQEFTSDYPGSAEQALIAYVRILLASNEFIHVD